MTREDAHPDCHAPPSQVLVSSLEGALPWEWQPQLRLTAGLWRKTSGPCSLLRLRHGKQAFAGQGTALPPEAPQLRAEWDTATPGRWGTSRESGGVRTMPPRTGPEHPQRRTGDRPQARRNASPPPGSTAPPRPSGSPATEVSRTVTHESPVLPSTGSSVNDWVLCDHPNWPGQQTA